jgi:hypothetical protein
MRELLNVYANESHIAATCRRQCYAVRSVKAIVNRNVQYRLKNDTPDLSLLCEIYTAAPCYHISLNIN